MTKITTSVLFLLVAHAAATGTSSGEAGFWKALGKFASGAVQPKQKIELLQNDDYCGGNCCSSADAIVTMDRLSTLFNTEEDPDTGLCFFDGLLYDELIAPLYMTMGINSVTLSTIMPGFDMKAAWKYVIENCIQHEVENVFAYSFPGGALVMNTGYNTARDIPSRGMFVLNENCQLTLTMHNYQSCYLGCAGVVADCPIKFPLPHQNTTAEEIANLYDDFMCFDVTDPPEVDFEDLGLCDGEGDQGENENDNGNGNKQGNDLSSSGAPMNNPHEIRNGNGNQRQNGDSELPGRDSNELPDQVK